MIWDMWNDIKWHIFSSCECDEKVFCCVIYSKSPSATVFRGGGDLVTKSCLSLVTPWTVVHQASLYMGFFSQEYWSGLPFPSPGEETRDQNPVSCTGRWILYHWATREAHCVQSKDIIMSSANIMNVILLFRQTA